MENYNQNPDVKVTKDITLTNIHITAEASYKFQKVVFGLDYDVNDAPSPKKLKAAEDFAIKESSGAVKKLADIVDTFEPQVAPSTMNSTGTKKSYNKRSYDNGGNVSIDVLLNTVIPQGVTNHVAGQNEFGMVLRACNAKELDFLANSSRKAKGTIVAINAAKLLEMGYKGYMKK